jgi:Na+/H+ antiporter NhaD/arsenite permease-like protein
MLLISRRFKGQMLPGAVMEEKTNNPEGNMILYSGIALLLFVPLFKTLTHTPPFAGMLLALGIIWIITSLAHRNMAAEDQHKHSVAAALQKIDTPGILFFLGILLAVSALQAYGLLGSLAMMFDTYIKNDYVTGVLLGLFSALVDNVPLVAAVQGMYGPAQYPVDHPFWEFLALTTGTGGSAMIIGSAAGVAIMGIENISFTWYLKNISLLALYGFLGGALVFILQQHLF